MRLQDLFEATLNYLDIGHNEDLGGDEGVELWYLDPDTRRVEIFPAKEDEGHTGDMSVIASGRIDHNQKRISFSPGQVRDESGAYSFRVFPESQMRRILRDITKNAPYPVYMFTGYNKGGELISEGKFRDAMMTGIAVTGFATAAAGAQEEIYNKMAPAPVEQPYEVNIDLEDVPVTEFEPETTEKKKVVKASKPSKSERLLALTIWGEARSHGESGMRAVGHVIMNRMKSERNFGDSVQDVVWKRKAFSCWNKGDPNREALLNIAQLKDSVDKKRWHQAKKIAHQIINGQSRDPTRGALFYHTDAIAPTWAKGVKSVTNVANHVFYKDDRKA